GLIHFGSHTMTHRGFVRRQRYADIDQELRQSKAMIESRTRLPCQDLAWPWGDYERDWLERARAAGYRSAATTRGGSNTVGSNPLELRRINVTHGDASWLAGRNRWQHRAWSASLSGCFQGWDRRFKVWLHDESPYSHG
ncbi:MAG TPA: polysaccharide deacetylase family protein, partial [Elusimicrobiota bacterium]|nr:polysaccharide deacetylase family protein [Elusimicrobiota bacterium]